MNAALQKNAAFYFLSFIHYATVHLRNKKTYRPHSFTANLLTSPVITSRTKKSNTALVMQLLLPHLCIRS